MRSDCKECRGSLDTLEKDPLLEMYTHLTGLCETCLRDALRESSVVYRLPQHPEEGDFVLAQCAKCAGVGKYISRIGQTTGDVCFTCGGLGFVDRSKKSVRRVSSWWATYQRNRQPR